MPMDNENSLLTIRSPDPRPEERGITGSLIDRRVFGIENCRTKKVRGIQPRQFSIRIKSKKS